MQLHRTTLLTAAVLTTFLFLFTQQTHILHNTATEKVLPLYRTGGMLLKALFAPLLGVATAAAEGSLPETGDMYAAFPDGAGAAPEALAGRVMLWREDGMLAAKGVEAALAAVAVLVVPTRLSKLTLPPAAAAGDWGA